MAELTDRIKHAWNAFRNRDWATPAPHGETYSFRPDRSRFTISNERSIVTSVYTRLAVDAASNNVRHVRTNDDGVFLSEIKSPLNACLCIEANVDQSGKELIQDAAYQLLVEGVIAIVAVDTTDDPTITGAFDVNTLRVGRIKSWFPRHVKIELYDDRPDQGKRQEIILPKSTVAIITNPFYAVMNEPNSTLQRLIAKLNILDAIDRQSGSGKLDIIIQLPYVVRSDTRKAQAAERRKDVEFQLQNSQYGVAYIDATEKVTQLNRPAENNMMAQIEYLTAMLYSQLGLTTSVFDGTADEKTMTNYHNRTVNPIMDAITNGLTRAFLTKTARSQNQAVMYFRKPFALLTISEVGEVADKLTRNAIVTSNEFRGFLGLRPSKDPVADELRNKNVAATNDNPAIPAMTEKEQGEPQNGTNP